jgi:FkbM family methyltransferase
MTLLGIAKPEYLFRPAQLMRRIARGGRPAPEVAVIELPWKLPLEVRPAETIGRGVWLLGVHELAVSEVLWRLIDPGEALADVGANSGYFTSLMASRAGAGGIVSAFEPHPATIELLSLGVRQWRAVPGTARIEVFPFALSDVEGHADLCLPPRFETNTGTAFLSGGGATGVGRGVRVETRRLDSVLGDRAPAVMKIDVEGHEAQVVAGAGALIGRVRDIVFEEHAPYPSRCATFLAARGYRIFRLERGLLRPRLERPDSSRRATDWEAPNYLATRDPGRALSRLAPIGWRCL